MSLLRNHITLMVLYAAATSIFFALLWKTERKERIVFIVKVFIALVVGGIAVAWAMYPFPLR